MSPQRTSRYSFFYGSRRLLAVALVASLAGCAGGSTRLPEPIAALEGEYDTRAQFAAAAESLRRAPAAGHPYDWLDRQAAVFTWVEAPAIGSHVLYLEWRAGGPEGPISRQRLWSFRRAGGEWQMDFYTLREPARFVGRAAQSGAFVGVVQADLVGYGAACTLGSRPLRNGLVFEIPASCQIVSRSGRPMTLTATVALTPDRLSYREAGTLPDGSFAFLVPGRPGLDYLFERKLRR